MPIILWIIIITAISGVVGTGLGGLIGAILRRDSSKIVSLLLSFAGGVMLAVVCFDLMQEALHPVENADNVPFYIVVLFVLVGYGIVFLLNYYIDKRTNKQIEHIDDTHPKAHDDLDELIHSNHLKHHKGDNKNLFIAGVVMAMVIALHNLPEGMVIGASYAADGVVVGGTGFLIAIVIGLHNIPEGMAVSVPLISGGMKKAKAVIITACSGIPTIIGAVLGYALGLISPTMLSIALSLASGAMLYVVFGELLPESILMWKSKLPAFFLLIGLLVGFILVQI